MADLYRTSQYFLTTLSVSGGIDASQTTDIVAQAVLGVDDTTKPGIALLNYSDPLDTSACEWITYTSINSTTKEFIGVARGQEGFSAKAHSNGVTIAFPLSKSHINNIVDKLEGLDDGVTLDSPTLTLTDATTMTTDGGILYDRTNEKLLIGDGTNTQAIQTGAWTAFTPSWTNLTPGAGTNTGAYCQIGKTVHFRTRFVFGGSSAVGTNPILTLPVGIATYGSLSIIGIANLEDSGTGTYSGIILSSGAVNFNLASGTPTQNAQINATTPFTWATNDSITITGTYQAA